MQVKPTVYRYTKSEKMSEALNRLFPNIVEWDCNLKTVSELDIIIYEVNNNDDAETLEKMLEKDAFFLFIAKKEFNQELLDLSKNFFFEFCHPCGLETDLVIRYNTILKYYEMRNELVKKSEELENTVFELAFASTNVLEQNEFLEQMAKKDGLTLLYNHSYFKDRLKVEFDKSKRYGNQFTLALLDLDFFKKINDTYGHLKGDEVLRSFAVIISENLRETDLAARYGGEEFAIIFTETDKEHAIIAIERIKEQLAKVNFDSEYGCFKSTFSGGVTSFSQAYSTSEEMIQDADRAMYISKSNGRNRITVL